jgi:hypothetical protein
MKLILFALFWGFLVTERCIQGFSTSFPNTKRSSFLPASSTDINEELDIQWNLFRKHHAKGAWKGIWTTYDYIGDVLDETVASVNYYTKNDNNVIEQTHTIVTGAKRSDCATCFDSFDIKEFPVALYDRRRQDNNVFSKTRFAANAMVNGPSLLRSGVMATELILAWGDGRVRVTFQHAPVWQQGVEPGSGPPQGLKLVRTIVSREALRDNPPTAETEAASPPAPNNPIFYRPVPPFNWYKKWAGTSWTWGPNAGNKGWAIENLEEEDSWQGISTVERWNLRLPGGIFIQAPRVITDMQAELCRLAWLPDDETLLRVEAGCLALQPMIMEDDELIGFYPPTLASLRCDVLKKMGELDQAPSFVLDQNDEAELMKPQGESDFRRTVAQEKAEGSTPSQQSEQPNQVAAPADSNISSTENDSGLDAIRNALSL